MNQELVGKVSIHLYLEYMNPEKINRSLAVSDIQIHSSRPAIAAQLLKGKTAAEALGLLPLIFSVCANAQTCAGVRAFEQAMGIRPAPATEWQRQMLVSIETLRELAWRILLDWPGFLKTGTEIYSATTLTANKANMASLIAHCNNLQRLLNQLGNAFEPYQDVAGDKTRDNQHPGNRNATRLDHTFKSQWTNLASELQKLFQQAIFQWNLEKWLTIADESQLQEWIFSNTTILGHVLQKIVTRNWKSSGQFNHPTSLYNTMTSNDSSSLSRIKTPLLVKLTAHYGNGLLPRIIARLTELAQLACSLTATLELVSSANQQQANIATQLQTNIRTGRGQVTAARGTLIHQVQLQQGKILDYQIVAPTDLHFHPNGVVSNALKQLSGNVHDIREQARMLIEVIDPCVGYDVHLHEQEVIHA